MNAMKNLHHIKAYSLVITVFGLFLFSSCAKDSSGIAEGEKKPIRSFVHVRQVMPMLKARRIPTLQITLKILVKIS